MSSLRVQPPLIHSCYFMGNAKRDVRFTCAYEGHFMLCNSGAPAAQRAAERSPILIWERKGNPSMIFLMVIMASGIACGRVRTMTTELHKMAATFQLIV